MRITLARRATDESAGTPIVQRQLRAAVSGGRVMNLGRSAKQVSVGESTLLCGPDETDGVRSVIADVGQRIA